MKPKTFLTVPKTNKSKSWCFKRTNKTELHANLIKEEKKKASKLETRGHNYIYGLVNWENR